MSQGAKKLPKQGASASFACGLFSKQDAMLLFLGGVDHVHSSMLGERDSCARVTRTILRSGEKRPYFWEQTRNLSKKLVSSSSERHRTIQEVILDLGIKDKSFSADRVTLVLEELLTNAIYHAHWTEGKRKYQRNKIARLNDKENVTVSYALHLDGIYLSVSDQGGMLTRQHLMEAFGRCRNGGQGQISSADSGAGLGLFMIFDSVNHIKIEVIPKVRTVVSVWMPHTGNFDRDSFSLNVFFSEAS